MRSLPRALTIYRVLRKHNLHARRLVVHASEQRGERIRNALEALGPIFIKFGQALSTRPDLLPPDIALALTQLQDRVTPFSGELASRHMEALLGRPLTDIFSAWDPCPLGAASIAQVHAATLHDGRSVVVKLLRPGIHQHIKRDLALMKRWARRLERYWKPSRRWRPLGLVEEFERHLLDELNLKREAANAAQLRRNFQGSTQLYVPYVVWEYTHETMLVMERIEGIPILNRDALVAAGVNIPLLAKHAVEIFFTQVFRDSFFHADLHAGNIFVSPERPQTPFFVCIDFGLMGSLSERDQHYIAANLYAFFNRDYRRVAELHMESGWIHADTRIERFESAIRAVSEPIFEKPLKDISFAQVVFNLIQTARKFHLNIQPQLVLLQKTLLSIEGLARELDPNLDLWTTAKPFLEMWIKEQIGLKAFLHNTQKNLPFLAEHLPELPRLLHEFLTTMGKQPHYQHRCHLSAQIKKRSWILASTTFVTGAFLSGWVFYQFF